MTVPRYGPAVLRALAAYATAYREYDCSPDDDINARVAFLRAEQRLWDALDMHAADAVPVLPDESERAPQPHRFGGIL